MKKLQTVVAYLAKNGVQFIKLSKKDIELLDKSTQDILNGVAPDARTKTDFPETRRAVRKITRKLSKEEIQALNRSTARIRKSSEALMAATKGSPKRRGK